MRKWMVLALATAMLAACNPFTQAEGARDEIDLFHERLNTDRIDAIWASADEELKATTTREDFARLLGSVHKSLGDVEETSQAGMKMNSGTQGTLTTVQMETHFANGSGVETFVFRGSGETLTLVGYHINSPDMMESYAEKPAQEGEGTAQVTGNGGAPEPPTLVIPAAKQ